MTARDLTLHYYREWRRKYGEPYSPAFGKHGSIFKRLLQAGHSGDALVHYIGHFLADSSNTFAARTGHSIEFFSSALPSIIAAVKEKEKRVTAGAVSNPDFDALEKARKQ